METRFLETFLSVVHHGSLAEAARRLGVTPAAIAQRIQALEEEFGLPLLTRSGRRVRPTEAGLAILEKSQQILNEIRDLKSMARSDEIYGELRLGAISTALTGYLPNALRHIFDTVPGVDVFLLPGTSAELYQQISDQKIDAAILVKPPFQVPKTLHWEPIRSEPFVLFAPPDAGDRTVDDLLRERPFIRYDRGNWGGRLADAYLQARGIRPKEWLELDSLEAIALMVEAGLGVSVMPDLHAPFYQKVQVARLPLNDAPRREIGLLWPRNTPASKLLRLILEALKK